MNGLLALSILCIGANPLTGHSAAPVSINHPPMNYKAVFLQPPRNVPTQGMPDGPLLGNGDVGVALSGPPEKQRFWLSKNDFWRRNPGDASIIAVGSLLIDCPQLKGATYYQEQNLALAEVRGTFTSFGHTLHTTTWVSATENTLAISLRWDGPTPLEYSFEPIAGPDEKEQRHTNPDGSPEICSFTRKADSLPGRYREVSVASRIIGDGFHSRNQQSLVGLLAPGETATIVTSILSDLDAPDFQKATARRIQTLGHSEVATLKARHRRWWSDFWAKSFIEIPDKEIEKRWYAALYTMGCCSRQGKVAPGLWGNWVTTDHPNWHGDFHLNYNFQAPYYIVYSSNHPELSAPFYQAIWESNPNGKAMAARHGWKGIHFPVCIGPWGLSPEDPDQDWGQRSDAAYAALNFIWQYEYTRDIQFLRKTAYPYLREVAEFWEDYLKLEDGRYVIHNDSIHEGSGNDTNSILSLGLVRTLFRNMIGMSRDLGLDPDRRAKWQDIVDRLSAFPVQERNGKTVFRYSETGMAWNDGNTLGIQHIFPAGAIGLNSDPKLVEVARNTISEMARWSDGNGFSSWYTACARMGIDPKLILAKMRAECDHRSYPNLVLTYGGGGIENVSGFLAINEMLMQSYEGVIRLFPNWPKDENARFGDLRAVGAFLVSAELKDGVVSGVQILSEKGLPCIVRNPWPGRGVRIVRSGQRVETVSGERFSFNMSSGERVKLEPE